MKHYILLQVHQNHVTQGRLAEELREWGVDISAGQVAHLLLEGHEMFRAEKDELLPVARQISDHLHCDDTSARQDMPGIRHSAWAALHAVTEYVDHRRTTRGRSDSERTSRRLQSLWFGSGAHLKPRAWDLALAMAT